MHYKAAYQHLVRLMTFMETIILSICFCTFETLFTLNGWDDHNGMFIHLEPDILECEVKWALGSNNMNKASVGDGIQDELVKILKDAAAKIMHPIF